MPHTQPEPKSSPSGCHFHWWWVVVLLIFAGFSFFGDKGVLRLVKTYNQRSELQSQVDQLVAENQQLKLKVESLKTDYQTIERIARQELGMVREDEIVYQFPRRPKQAPPSSR